MRATFSVALLVSASVSAGCGDDAVCGPDDVAAEELGSYTLEDELVQWQDFRSSPNNDCGEAGGPISLTLEANQAAEPERSLVLCLPRPDKLSGKTVDVNDTDLLRIIDVFATVERDAASCLASLDRSRAMTGSVGFYGVCEAGLDPAGYSLEFAMTLPVALTCDEQVIEDELRFEGAVRVRAE